MYAITFYHQYIGRIVAVLSGLIALAVFLYGAFLLGAVAHAAGRTTAEAGVRSLSASISVLEGQYLAETKALSPRLAADMGFVAPSSVVTVYTGGSSLVLR